MRRELARLELYGFSLAVFACSPASRCDTWLASELRAPMFRPDDYLHGSAPWRRIYLCAQALRELRHARTLFPNVPRGLAAAGSVAWTAATLRPLLVNWKPDWVHAHFLGKPAAIACLLAEQLHVPFSISAHARDVFVPLVRLASVCARARFVAACSEHTQASLMGRLPAPLAERVVYFPHHVDCPPILPELEPPKDTPLRLLSVCRLVPKKGIDTVLRALALLKSELRFHYRIVGDGPELKHLRALTRNLGLKDVEFVGTLPPDAIPIELTHADIFVLGSRTAPDGDRDGIPNAMLEAMAAGVPVVVSDGGAVYEVIRHRQTGWLPPPNQPQAFADSLKEAASDQILRRSVAVKAYIEVKRRFSTDENPSLLALRLSSEMTVTGNASNLQAHRPIEMEMSNESHDSARL